MEHLRKAFSEGFVYSGQYSRFRKRRHGNSSNALPAEKFIVFAQNHDQVGNRMTGDRLSQTQSFEKLKLCAGTVIFSPYIPLLFMGEEYGETAGFQYFISHTDNALIENVRKGRKEEFTSLGWLEDIPDPQAESSFLNSKIHIDRHEQGNHKMLFEFYRELLRLRKEIPALCNPDKARMEVAAFESEKVLMLRRWNEGDEAVIISSFNENKVAIAWPFRGAWSKTLDSCSDLWGGNRESAPAAAESRGPGSSLSLAPFNFVFYRKCRE